MLLLIKLVLTFNIWGRFCNESGEDEKIYTGNEVCIHILAIRNRIVYNYTQSGERILPPTPDKNVRFT